MSRPWRIEYKGAFYLVLARGNDGRAIFSDDDDRIVFLDLLSEMSERFEIEIYAYVLMGNHYHLLLKTKRPNLSRSMQWFVSTYTRRFNNKHRRNGHLFQGRFKNILLESRAQILALSLYIHRNPLRAKMVKRLSEYKWSSYLYYAYGKRPKAFLWTNCILSQLTEPDKHKAYRERAQESSKKEHRTWEELKHGLFFGSQKFVDKIKSKYLSKEIDADVPQKRRVLKDANPGVFLRKGARLLKCDIQDFVDAGRVSGDDKIKRDLLMHYLWKSGLYNNKEIGQLFGLSQSSVSRQVTLLKSELPKNRKLKKQFDSFNATLKA